MLCLELAARKKNKKKKGVQSPKTLTNGGGKKGLKSITWKIFEGGNERAERNFFSLVLQSHVNLSTLSTLLAFLARFEHRFPVTSLLRPDRSGEKCNSWNRDVTHCGEIDATLTPVHTSQRAVNWSSMKIDRFLQRISRSFYTRLFQYSSTEYWNIVRQWTRAHL